MATESFIYSIVKSIGKGTGKTGKVFSASNQWFTSLGRCKKKKNDKEEVLNGLERLVQKVQEGTLTVLSEKEMEDLLLHDRFTRSF